MAREMARFSPLNLFIVGGDALSLPGGGLSHFFYIAVSRRFLFFFPFFKQSFLDAFFERKLEMIKKKRRGNWEIIRNKIQMKNQTMARFFYFFILL